MKNENSTLVKKLAQYSAVAAPMLALAGIADAQIFYKDVNPDKVLDTNNEKQKIDLNNDGTMDFSLRHRILTGSGALHLNDAIQLPYFTYSAFNAIGGIVVSSSLFSTNVNFLYPYALSSGATINSNVPWYTMGDILFPYGSSIAFFSPEMALYSLSTGGYGGYWLGVNDMYLALRVDDGTNQYYGWARCDVASDGTSTTLKDYACNLVAGDGILAGEAPVGVNSPEDASDVLIFAFNKVLNVNFTTHDLSGATIQLFNVTGQEVLSENITSANNAINLQQFAAGNYMVKLNYDGKVATKKIAI